MKLAYARSTASVYLISLLTKQLKDLFHKEKWKRSKWENTSDGLLAELFQFSFIVTSKSAASLNLFVNKSLITDVTRHDNKLCFYRLICTWYLIPAVGVKLAYARSTASVYLISLLTKPLKDLFHKEKWKRSKLENTSHALLARLSLITTSKSAASPNLFVNKSLIMGVKKL